MKRQFVWDAWDYDCDGEAYIIAKDACPKRERMSRISFAVKTAYILSVNQKCRCRKVGAAGKFVRTGKMATGSRKVGIAYTTVRYLGLSLFGLCVKKNGIDSYTIAA